MKTKMLALMLLGAASLLMAAEFRNEFPVEGLCHWEVTTNSVSVVEKITMSSNLVMAVEWKGRRMLFLLEENPYEQTNLLSAEKAPYRTEFEAYRSWR